MKNTTFRRRALLSSVAMLLIALVALGSATFAWFSTTTTATASSMKAKTDKASNILLSETGDSGWTQNLTFALNTAAGTTAGNTSMTPVTTKDFSDWYTVQAENYNQGYNSTNTYSAVQNIQSSGTYAKYTTLYIQSTTEDASVTISPVVSAASGTDTTGIDYVRVAVVPRAASGNATAATTGNKVFGSNNDRSKETAGWTAASQTANSIVTGPIGTAQTLGTLTAGEIYGYDIYVYFEGTDFDCKDQFAGGDLNVTFNIAKA